MPFDFRGGEQSPQSIEGNDLASPCLQLLGNASGPHTVRASFSTSQEGPAEILLPSSLDGVPSDPTSHAAGDDDICVESDCELCHISNVSSPREVECTEDLLHEKGGVTTSSYIVFEDGLGRHSWNYQKSITTSR